MASTIRLASVFFRLIRSASPKRVTIVLICITILGYLLGRAVAPIVSDVREAMDRASIGGGVEPYEYFPKQSKEYNEYMDWLRNDLAQKREPWDVKDATKLMVVLDQRFTQEQVENIAMRPGASIQDQEPRQRFTHTRNVIAIRMQRNEPIHPEARAMLTMAITDALEDPYWDVRNGIVQAVCHARLVTDPAIRAKIEAMYNDPNDRVAANARNQLAWFDETERLRKEGKWYKPRIKD